MSEIASASINSFGSKPPRADSVSPSEEAIFVLTSSQLQAIITGAVQDLKEEVAALREERDQDREDLAALRQSVATLETRQEDDVSRICCDIAYDRQRLTRLEGRPSTTSTPPAPPKGAKTLARIAKIDEVLKTRGATTLKELERIIGIDRATMTRLLAKLDMRRYELHSRPGDDREKVLRLKVQIR